MKKIAQIALFIGLSASSAFAGTVRAPEIDAASGAAAVALLSGGVVVLRSRRRKQ